MGFADEQIEMRNVVLRGDLRTRVFGSTIAPIWREFMQIVTSGLPIEDFADDPEGIAAYYQTPRVEVPDIIGLDIEEAQEEILKAGFEFEVELVNSDEPEDIVVAIVPEPGERLRQGETVTIEVSNGLSPTTLLPDLLGKTEADALQTLLTLQQNTQIGFTWVVEQAPTEIETQNGRVIGTTPATAAEIDAETTIIVTLGEYTPPEPPPEE